MGAGADGQVAAVFLGPEPGGPMRRVASADAQAGSGIVGDRYFGNGGHDPSEEITVFAREDVDEANDDADVAIDATDLRRNVMTAGIDLRELHGTALRIGDVVVDSLEANPPCSHLQELAGKPLLRPLVSRGGVRGRIRVGGTIREGDRVEWLADEPG